MRPNSAAAVATGKALPAGQCQLIFNERFFAEHIYILMPIRRGRREILRRRDDLRRRAISSLRGSVRDLFGLGQNRH